MTISQSGSVNTTALIVPGLLVQIVPPQNLVINGVPTNRIGVVGTASWGPVNKASICSSAADYARAFGPVMARKYDMGTQVATAVQQGASDFRCIRVTDGTDVKAVTTTGGSSTIPGTLQALFTGTLGNTISYAQTPGSKAGTLRVTITCPGFAPEVFDNISLTGSGSTTAPYVAICAAINSGTGVLRGPSQFITAAVNASVVAPETTGAAHALGTTTPGTDGVTTITSAVLVGSDSAVPRTGMYGLRKQGCSIGVLADGDDSTQWTTIDGFGLAEGIYMIQTLPAGTAITAAVSAKSGAGLDSYGTKLLHGDWIYWNDQTNNVLRLVSPQGFIAGRLANLSPEQSSLNKPLYGVVGSQLSGTPGGAAFQTYSDAELAALIQPGIDVIGNPSAGGTYWGAKAGHNSSSDPSRYGDNYTRMTNYIAKTVDAGMGVYIGLPITPSLFQRIRATLLSFMQNMLQQGILGLTVDGKLPFNVVCDDSNNPLSRTSGNYVQADVQVQYMGINEKFIINIEGGTTVVVTRQTLPAGQI